MTQPTMPVRLERQGMARLCPDCLHRIDQHHDLPGQPLELGCMLCACAMARGGA